MKNRQPIRRRPKCPSAACPVTPARRFVKEYTVAFWDSWDGREVGSQKTPVLPPSR